MAKFCLQLFCLQSRRMLQPNQFQPKFGLCDNQHVHRCFFGFFHIYFVNLKRNFIYWTWIYFASCDKYIFVDENFELTEILTLLFVISSDSSATKSTVMRCPISIGCTRARCKAHKRDHCHVNPKFDLTRKVSWNESNSLYVVLHPDMFTLFNKDETWWISRPSCQARQGRSKSFGRIGCPAHVRRREHQQQFKCQSLGLISFAW
jgi:hypothetical protein